jgi:hypothetical protein
MRVKLIGIALLAAIGFAEPVVIDTGGLWRQIKRTLTTEGDGLAGDRYFQNIQDARIPPAHLKFHGSVVSEPSSSELIVNVDDPAGDARLRCLFGLKDEIPAGTSVHFEGVVRAYTTNPYTLTLDVRPEDIDGLP